MCILDFSLCLFETLSFSPKVLRFKSLLWWYHKHEKVPPILQPDLELPHSVFFRTVLETWSVCIQICHTTQDHLWKLEVRRLLQWAGNGRIMQLRSSGCPHYLAAVVINGLKCMLSKSQEKCDSSSKIQMVPLQWCSKGSQYMLFIM